MLITILFSMLLLQQPPQEATRLVVAPTTAPTTQPTTLPVQIVVTAAPATQPAEALKTDNSRIDIMKLVRGEQRLTLEQLLGLGPWVQIATDLVVGVLSFIPRVIVALFLFFIFWLIFRGVRRVLMASMNRAGIDPSIRDMMVSLLKWATLGFGLVIAGNQIGIQIAALLTGVSIIGLAVGFAAQETLSNFIAGVVIFWDKPFRLGDWVEIDGTFGQVQRVTFRSTRLLNLDGETVLFPNTYVLSHRVSNHSTHPINRVSVRIGIAYKESISRAREVILGLTRGDARLCDDPAPDVVVDECADSSVNLVLRFWIKDEAIERLIRFEYTEKVKNALDQARIEIPFPHMQLMVESTPAISLLAAGGGAPGA
jgi:small conductance mechanosensitive channel